MFVNDSSTTITTYVHFVLMYTVLTKGGSSLTLVEMYTTVRNTNISYQDSVLPFFVYGDVTVLRFMGYSSHCKHHLGRTPTFSHVLQSSDDLNINQIIFHMFTDLTGLDDNNTLT